MLTRRLGMGRRVLVLCSALLGCNEHDDADDHSTAASQEDEERCEATRAEVVAVCIFPNEVSIIEGADRPPIIDIAASSTALNSGFLLPKLEPGDALDPVGFVLEDNPTCRVACLVPCNVTLHSLCVTEWPWGEVGDGSPAGCLFCGEADRTQCQSFIDSCP